MTCRRCILCFVVKGTGASIRIHIGAQYFYNVPRPSLQVSWRRTE
jgi:hypothetical protein